VLSYDQAQNEARDWRTSLLANDRGEVAPGTYTVADAMSDYLKDRERERRKKLPRTRSVVNTHILPTLGTIRLEDLKHGKVKAWRDSVAEAMPQVRKSPNSAEQAFRQVDLKDEEIARKRQATANRIYTVFRAALNYAYKHGKISSDSAWKRIEPFKQVDAAKVRYLSVNECKSLISACPGDFQELVRGALYTGCRYGELIAMRADAFNSDANTIHIPRSKSGKQRYIPLTDEGAAFFQGITGDKDDEDSMFAHSDGPCAEQAWEESQQRYWIELACEKAAISPAIGFHILRHTYASQLAMNGTPMPVIASLLGHADTRMTEKHYGHLSPSYIATTLRANLPSFGFVPVAAPGPMLVSRAS
jgi:integrase